MTVLKHLHIPFYISAVFLLATMPGLVGGQSDFPYRVHLKAMNIEGLPAMHSFVYGQSDGKWVIIGGRTDGLHARQPFRSFPEEHNNKAIYVVDPERGRTWSAPTNTLQTSLAEQLQSSNMQFYQDGENLILIGGYGYSESEEMHITYPFMTIVNLTGLIPDILAKKDIRHNFLQVEDDFFAVTGGGLAKNRDTLYLVGGHRFDGAYNPMNMPSFTQTYTNQVKKFSYAFRGDGIALEIHDPVIDPLHLHRRDFNLLPFVTTEGEIGHTIFSGVFQYNADLPYLYPVDIMPSGCQAHPKFNQYLSHYHSAHISMYDEQQGKNHHLFFGGISTHFMKEGEVFRNADVPFVNTISSIVRDSVGSFQEFLINEQMPGFLGTSAGFLANSKLPLIHGEIINFTTRPADTVLLGYIVGGIVSEAMNPFTYNNTEVTRANDTIYRVYLYPAAHDDTLAARLEGEHNFNIEIVGTPARGQKITLRIVTPDPGKLEIFIVDPGKSLCTNEVIDGLQAGIHEAEIELPNPMMGKYAVLALFNGRLSAETEFALK